MGCQNFTEEHFILLCLDVHAQGQGMTANNSLKYRVRSEQGILAAASRVVLGRICFD